MSIFRRQAIAAGGDAATLDPYYPYLIADIRPNSGGTAMVDYSPYGWTVTEVGAGSLTYDTDKATFDGTNYLTVNIDPALLQPGDVSDITIEVSASIGATTTYQFICHAGTTSVFAWTLDVAATTGLIGSYRNNTGVSRASGTAVSGSREDYKLLINNSKGLVLTDNVPNSSSAYLATTFGSQTIDKFYIGYNVGGGSSILTSGSEIYRVRIYRGILKHDIAVPTAALPDPTGDSNVEIQLDFDGSITDASDNAYSFTGGAVDTNNPKFGSGNMVATATGGSGAQTTLNSGYGTGDYGFEGWFSPADEAVAYRLMVRIGHTWLYRYGNILQIWEANSTLKVFTNTPVLKQDTYRHYYYAKKNGIGILWVNGRICLFWADTINNTGTVFIVSAASVEFYGDIDDVRLTNSGDAHVPTLMRDEDLPGDLSDDNPANFFGTTIYTGTGSSKSLNFASFDVSTGAMSLVKNRGVASRSNVVTDTERGATQTIYTDATTAEATQATYVTSFDSDGITVGTGNLVNENTYLHSADVFAATNSAAVTVDSQSLTLKHSGKGFGMIEIDRALGGASASITIDISAMGLASAPMVWVKNCDSAVNWAAWHPDLTSGYYILLNSNGAEANTNAANFFGNNSITVDPTATTITLGSNTSVGGSGADRIIVYIFGEISTDDAENYIKLLTFSHTSGQSSYDECGWHPRLSVCKASSTTGDWATRNSTRGTGKATLLNSSAAEATDYGSHGPFGLELNGTYAVTGTIIGMAVR